MVIGGLWSTLFLALLPPSVEARCPQGWDVGSEWTFQQDGPLIVSVKLRQDGVAVSGTATFTGTTKKEEGGLFGSFGEKGLIHGTVDGTVQGDQFDVKIYWSNKTVGIYEGTIRPSGRIEGKGWEQSSRGTKVKWHSTGVMNCVDEKVVVPNNPTPKPISNSGKVPATPPPPKPIGKTGKAKTQSSPAAPTITVRPVLLTIPDGQAEGTVTLTWDGGPDHPDARPWLKAGGSGEEVMVADQAKGTRPVRVERDKNHLFILKDSGQQLAKAVVISKR